MSLDSQGLIDLSKLEKKDYSKLCLKRNPFPSTAIPSEIPQTTADRQDVLRRFTDVLKTLRSDGSSSVTVLLGDYGTGKSHLLKLFKVSVNKALFAGDNPILAIYAKSPGRNIRELFLYMIDDLTREFLSDLSINWLFKRLFQQDFSKYMIKGKTSDLTNVSDIPLYLQNAKTLDLVNELKRDFADVGNDDLVRAFLILPHPELGSIAWRWLVGSSLSRDECNLLGIEETIQDVHVAEKVTTAFLKLLHFIGISGTVILIDELEALTLILGISKGIYQDALRHLIDANPTGSVMVFAITPGAWDKLTETPSGLERRLASSVFDLPPFDLDCVRELVQKYIGISRSSDFEARRKQLDSEIQNFNHRIFPFDDGAIEDIFSATRGIASKVVALCRLCVDDASDSGCPINADFVQTVIKREGFR